MGICMRAIRESWSLCGFNWEVNYVWAPRWPGLGGLGLWSGKGGKVSGGGGNSGILPSLLKKISINVWHLLVDQSSLVSFYKQKKEKAGITLFLFFDNFLSRAIVVRMAFDNLCVIFPRRGVTGGGWEFGILAPLHQITPHTAWPALFWALFLLIYISSLMPPHLFLFSFSINFPGSLQIATNVQIWQMQTKCKKIWAKNEGGGVGLSVIPFCVLASYVWVRFPRFCRLPTRADGHSTLAG